jgi:hypothetical protein
LVSIHIFDWHRNCGAFEYYKFIVCHNFFAFSGRLSAVS